MLPLVATNDVRFLTEEEFEAHETRVVSVKEEFWMIQNAHVFTVISNI